MHVNTMFILLVQVTLILLASRVMGTVAAWLRQPRVVGEMVAGIMLGPSLFGWLAPDLAGDVFPDESVRLLNVLAQIGVIFFLFLIGLELDPKLLRKEGHSAFVISHISIIAPFVLGAVLTLMLYPLLFNDTTQMRFTPVALFMGAAMSITAFPVLARILTERGLVKTKIGAVAIACAAIDDVSAWCMLAFVVAIGRAEGLVPGLITAGLSGVYILTMFFAVRPALSRLQRFHESRSGSSQAVVATVLVLVLLSAAVTEIIGIHALFGAFLMGAIMPKEASFVRLITDKLEDVTILFLLPIFFAYAGLRTQIGLLDSPYLWGLTGLVVAVACLGKFGGSALAARACGLTWRESSAIGILMNTRGLMELVILTLGLQMGVITDAVFAMMVIMALVTTAMTSPILALVYPQRMFGASTVNEEQAAREYGVVIPVSRPESGTGLVRVAAGISTGEVKPKVYALSLVKPTVDETLGVSVSRPDPGAPDPLEPLMTEAAQLNLPCEAIVFPSRDIPSDIGHIARAKRADLVLMGYHKPVFGHTILGGTVHRVLAGTDADVAIFVDRGLSGSPSILVPFQGSAHDRLAVELALRMGREDGVSVTVLHVVVPGDDAEERGAWLGQLKLPQGVQIWKVEDESPIDAVLRQSGDFNLIVVGLTEEWGLESHLFGLRAERIAEESRASLLLVRKYSPLYDMDVGSASASDHAAKTPTDSGAGADLSKRLFTRTQN